MLIALLRSPSTDLRRGRRAVLLVTDTKALSLVLQPYVRDRCSALHNKGVKISFLNTLQPANIGVLASFRPRSQIALYSKIARYAALWRMPTLFERRSPTVP
jgi:hypothetical protein